MVAGFAVEVGFTVVAGFKVLAGFAVVAGFVVVAGFGGALPLHFSDSSPRAAMANLGKSRLNLVSFRNIDVLKFYVNIGSVFVPVFRDNPGSISSPPLPCGLALPSHIRVAWKKGVKTRLGSPNDDGPPRANS